MKFITQEQLNSSGKCKIHDREVAQCHPMSPNVTHVTRCHPMSPDVK